MCPGCATLCMRSPTGKEDFLWVCGRRVTEPALLSDDRLSACSISKSQLSDSPSLPLICRSHLIIAPSLSQTLHCTVPTPSPTSPFHCWGGKATQIHPPSCVSPSLNATHPSSLQFHPQTNPLNQHADSVRLVTYPLPDQSAFLLN